MIFVFIVVEWFARDREYALEYISFNKYMRWFVYILNCNNYMFSDSHGMSLGAHTQDYGVYNFSADSDSYIDVKRKINFLKENIKMDTIYLSADEQMLSPYRERLNNMDKSSFYATLNDYETLSEYYKNGISQKVVYFQPKMGTVLRKYFVSKIENIFVSHSIEKDKSKSPKLKWNNATMTSKEVIVKNRLKKSVYF